ncbi:alpha/beta hydrolase family protein [Runella sp.]|uniref:alpha/beta hydrolase family protein n=1 Tax=Runella sp. TaxID=1960881 RepID=UPI003D148019
MTGKMLLLFALTLLIGPAYSQSPQRPDFLIKDSIQSSLDRNVQVFYYDKSTASSPQPLVVELHSWSNSADSQKDMVAVQAHAKEWNYIFPNFRGVNNHPKACCSEFVISDIDEAIDWAVKNMKVDTKHIYVIGTSGGGYATLAMYMKSRHTIHTFSAWAAISDLEAWYGESSERKNKYAAEIVKCIGAGETFDAQKAKERSPLFWKTPVKKRKNSQLQIYAGIHDGYTGSVPISHSINFYNKLLTDNNEKDKSHYVSETDAITMLKTQTFPTSNPPEMIGDRAILYQKSSKKITLTIFEGTHEILKNVALELVEAPKS